MAETKTEKKPARIVGKAAQRLQVQFGGMVIEVRIAGYSAASGGLTAALLGEKAAMPADIAVVDTTVSELSILIRDVLRSLKAKADELEAKEAKKSSEPSGSGPSMEDLLAELG